MKAIFNMFFLFIFNSGRVKAMDDDTSQIVFYFGIVSAVMLALIMIIIVIHLCYYCKVANSDHKSNKRRIAKSIPNLNANDKRKGQFGDLDSNLEINLNVSEISIGEPSDKVSKIKIDKDKTSVEKIGSFFEDKKKRKSKVYSHN